MLNDRLDRFERDVNSFRVFSFKRVAISFTFLETRIGRPPKKNKRWSSTGIKSYNGTEKVEMSTNAHCKGKKKKIHVNSERETTSCARARDDVREEIRGDLSFAGVSITRV